MKIGEYRIHTSHAIHQLIKSFSKCKTIRFYIFLFVVSSFTLYHCSICSNSAAFTMINYYILLNIFHLGVFVMDKIKKAKKNLCSIVVLAFSTFKEFEQIHMFVVEWIRRRYGNLMRI